MAQQQNFTRRQFLKATASGGASYTLAALADNSAPENIGPTTQVTSIGGVPTFVCDDKAVFRPAFETYVPTQHYFKQFAEAGTRIFGFSTNAAACDYGHSSTTWIDTDTWDYSQFEKRADAVLSVKPNALLLPRVNLGTPRWWLQDHPEALELFDDDSTHPTGANPTLPKDRAFPSLASPQWRNAIANALQRFIQHVHKSRYCPHIFGWCLSGMHTEEFYHWACNTERLAGYSIHTVIAFREWLRDKYKEPSALREVWGRNDVDFNNAAIPTRQERLHNGDGMFRNAQHRNVVDFYLFWNELIPDTIDYFARIVKDACHNKKVVGAFYGYMYEFAGDPEFGHNALGRYLDSPNLDLIAVTASYFNRGSGTGGDYARSPAASVRLHGKLWYHDNDAVSFLAKDKLKAIGFKDDNPDWTRNLAIQLDSLGYTDTARKSRWMYQRGLGFALCNGMFQAWFDLHGGYFDNPELMSEVKSLNNLAAQVASLDRSSIAEILVVTDEASCAWCRPRSPLLRELLLTSQNQLIRIGAPVDHILLDDLKLIETSRYKLVIFLNCFYVTSTQRKVIEKKLKSDGKYLLWYSAAGWLSETGRSAELCRELTGFELIQSNSDSSGLSLKKKNPQKLIASPPKEMEIGVIENDNWTSVWIPTTAIPTKYYRELAKSAGVHIFNDQDDALYANSSMICIHSKKDGLHTLRFPSETNISDAISNELIASSVKKWTRKLALGETCLLYWKAV
jgi:hypothetical protein